MSENLIELKHISRQFDDGFVVVEDLNLEIAKGEFVTFLGPSGCGKTTTLRMIAGFDLPSKGQILLNGEDITKLPPNERPINTVFQRYALFPHLNVYENIAFGLKLKAMDKEIIHEKVKKALEVVDLEGFEKRKITTLSGGQQQRVAIARAIVNEPQILLLDEPLGALDLKMRKEMQLELKSMHEKLGITFIYVTHDQEEALTMSDKVVVMSDGEILQIGTPEEIYNEPNTVFVADFIGESNIYNGRMVAQKTVNFLGASFPCLDDLKVKSKVDVIVRPEDIIMTEKDAGMINGVVQSVIFKGMHYEIVVISGESEIVIQSTKSAVPGSEIGMIIEPDGIHVIQADTNVNIFDGVLAADSMVEFADGSFECDLTSFYAGSSMNEDGELVDAEGNVIDYVGTEVTVTVDPSAPVMSDNPDEGGTRGNIISLIYKGDHYHYIVRTENEEDIHLHDEYLWNEGDYVSVIINKDQIKITSKEA